MFKKLLLVLVPAALLLSGVTPASARPSKTHTRSASAAVQTHRPHKAKTHRHHRPHRHHKRR